MDGKTVTIRVAVSDWAPGGAVIQVPSWHIRQNVRAYFDKATTISGINIPADTLLLLEADGDHYKATSMTGTWRLHVGIHRGTLMSRDTDNPEGGFESLEAAKKHYLEGKANWGAWGYQCWFAYAFPPNGTDKDKIKIDESIPYR